MKAENFNVIMARVEAQNVAQGLCPVCGGAGEIYDISAITRTGNPYASRRCGRCRGTGKHVIPDAPIKEPVTASPVPERAALVREVHMAFNVAVHRAGGPRLPACDGLDCAICEHVREAAALLKGEQS